MFKRDFDDGFIVKISTYLIKFDAFYMEPSA